jgi:hypothetical protein
MSDKQLADIVCRSLLAIVAGLRRKYELPDYQNIVIEIRETDSIASAVPLAEKEQIG